MSSLTGRRLCLLAGSNKYSKEKEKPYLVTCFLFYVNSLIELYNQTCSFSSPISAVGHLLISFQKSVGPRKWFASTTVCKHAQAKKNKCLHYYQRGEKINKSVQGGDGRGRKEGTATLQELLSHFSIGRSCSWPRLGRVDGNSRKPKRVLMKLQCRTDGETLHFCFSMDTVGRRGQNVQLPCASLRTEKRRMEEGGGGWPSVQIRRDSTEVSGYALLNNQQHYESTHTSQTHLQGQRAS